MAIYGTTAEMFADYILVRSAEMERPVSNLVLQKILYACQHDALRSMGRPLFDDEFTVQGYGPIVNSVYRKWTLHGGRSISVFGRNEDVVLRNAELLDGRVAARANKFIEVMGKLPPWELQSIVCPKDGVWKTLYDLYGESDALRIPKRLIALDEFSLSDFEKRVRELGK